MSDCEKKNCSESLKKRLTTIQYEVTQNCETEEPFSGKYNDCYDDGIYSCVCCGNKLFYSKTKFDSASGWPAFSEPVSAGSIKSRKDTSLGMIRTEVICAECEAHLGHVFPDGRPSTGVRYCVNSASLEFKVRVNI